MKASLVALPARGKTDPREHPNGADGGLLRGNDDEPAGDDRERGRSAADAMLL
jgi:hypothetical protein